jgi:pimeloyl-ACP methyl ester carboxylesterase
MSAWSSGIDADFVHVDAPYSGGWAATRDWLVALVAREGPFDGVFGFSQGAALAALMAPLFRFAIVVGGFMTAAPAHAIDYQRLRDTGVPSLHIIGRSDGVVPSQASHDLAACFRAPVVVEHPGGHVVAATPEVRAATQAFLSMIGCLPA